MTHRFLYALVCTALAVSGCQRAPKVDREAALEVVRRNAQFMQEEKIDEMMKTIHPQSPVFAGTRTAMENLAKKFDLKCELSGLEVVSASEDEIRVRFAQKTEKIKGDGEFPTTRLVGIHTLKKDGDAWKIFATETISTEVLDTPDKKPEPSEKPEPPEKPEPEDKQ